VVTTLATKNINILYLILSLLLWIMVINNWSSIRYHHLLNYNKHILLSINNTNRLTQLHNNIYNIFYCFIFKVPTWSYLNQKILINLNLYQTMCHWCIHYVKYKLLRKCQSLFYFQDISNSKFYIFRKYYEKGLKILKNLKYLLIISFYINFNFTISHKKSMLNN